MRPGPLPLVLLLGSLTPSVRLQAQAPAPWPAADALFRADSRWAGGDGASSVSIGSDAILWLFADSFVRRSQGRGRANSVMIRNSIAIQTGLDPATSRLNFYWSDGVNGPSSYFPEEAGTWFWPGGAVQLDSGVLLFLMQVRKTPDSAGGAFGFEVFDWRAVAITNVPRGPSGWTRLHARTASNPFRVIVGSGAALQDGDHLYAFGAREPGGDHAIFLTRWPLTEVAALDLSDPEWWCGGNGWIRQSRLRRAPEPLFDRGQTEFSVHRDTRLGKYVVTQTVGFGSALLGFRFADRPEGPWSEPRVFFRPPESDHRELFVYAGKAHPDWRSTDLVVSYVANAWDFWKMANDSTLYFPRLVRVPHGTLDLLASKRP